MAFEPKNFVLCSKFNLFKAHANLWIYTTMDTLEDCLAEHYFQPRLNLKNQDSPEVGDVIQCIVEGAKLAYLKIVGKTEKPYYITVARTFLENEAVIIAELADKASKATDFSTPITDENLGITQAEQSELEDKIDLAANSGRMITAQGYWYAKMYSTSTVPSAEDGTNYADFSQVDADNNPIIVTYNRVNGAWVQDQTITPPADYDGYVAITSKIWDIPEQDGQQGGRILWNHVSKEFTPYPQIVSFDSVELTGDSTVVMPVNPDGYNIANVDFVLDHTMSRNIGDIFFTSRTDAVLNGAVPCDGTTYQTTDFSGAQAPGVLLQAGKLPYVSLATYATLLSTQGYCDRFGWDGVGTTAFRVPTLDLHHTVVEILEPTSANPYWYRRYADGWVEQGGIYVASANAANVFVPFPFSMADTNYTLTTTYNQPTAWESNTGNTALNVTCRLAASTNRKVTNGFYFNSVGVDGVYSWRVSGKLSVGSKTLYQRAMVQLSSGMADQSLGMLAEVAYTGDYSDLLNKPTIPTNVSQLTNDSGYIDSIKTINNNSLVGSGNVELSTYLPFGNWPTTGTTKLFCDAIATDTSAVKGKAYLGEVTFSDLPAGMANGDVVVEIMDGTTALNKVITLTLTSGNVSPYMWKYVYWNNGNNVSGWQTWATTSQIPTVNNSTIKITQGGVTKGSFTLNQSSGDTIALDAGSGGSVPLSIDAEIVGTLTVASDGDVSGFGYNNYMVIPTDLDISNTTSFEMVFAFNLSNEARDNAEFLGIYKNPKSSAYFALNCWRNAKHLTFRAFKGVGQEDTIVGTTELSSDTKYYTKIQYDGTDYKLFLSTDGVNWTLEGSVIATYIPSGAVYEMGRGNLSTPGVYNIYMSECYIKKDGVLVWQGMDAPGLHQRVAKGHEVIAFQPPTANNNYTWYRKYADGWVEQGGISNTDSGTSGTITLPITMQDNNYTAIAGNGNNAANNYFTISRPEATTTTIKWYKSSSSMNGYWEVKGMYSQS